MKPAEDRLAPELRAIERTPRVPIVASVDAEPKRDAAVGDRGAGAAGLIAVRWEAVVRAPCVEGVTT
jgi:hypothetical protein